MEGDKLKGIFDGSESHCIVENTAPITILEAGINHNGQINLAIQMIDLAKKLGADAVKFQTFKAEEFCGDDNQLFTYKSQGKTVTESMREMFKRNEFTIQEWKTIADYCQQVGITFLSTPQNLSDLEMLNELGIPAIKVGSDDLTNTPLIRSYAKFGKPIILSSGMSNLGEIFSALDAAGWFDGNDVTVLICTSLYPTESKSAGINRVKTLRAAFPGLRVGFSDHTIGSTAAILALALGAKVFEKHFTLDHDLPGPDHWFSANPSEIEKWILDIREGWEALGNSQLIPMPAEIHNKNEFQRKVTAIRKIEEGELYTLENIGLRRVAGGKGYPPEFISIFLEKKSNRKYVSGEAIDF